MSKMYDLLYAMINKVNSSAKVETASVGQTLVVKEVDKNGKPTAWEAVDRTHWTEGNFVEILPETTLEFNNYSCNHMVSLNLVVGEKYNVVYDGVTYEVVAKTINTNQVWLGIGDGVVEVFSITDVKSFAMFQIEENKTSATFAIYQGTEEVVHKLDGKYLPADVPHIEADGIEEILPACQAQYLEDGLFGVHENVPTINAGINYIISWNGVDYECLGVDMSGAIPGAVLLGNGEPFGLTSNGEPFVLIWMYEDGANGIQTMALDGATELTISISKKNERFYKINPMLLPDNVVNEVVIVGVAVDGDMGPISATHTAYEIMGLVMAGKSLFFNLYGYLMPIVGHEDADRVRFESIFTNDNSLRHRYVVVEYDGIISDSAQETTLDIG